MNIHNMQKYNKHTTICTFVCRVSRNGSLLSVQWTGSITQLLQLPRWSQSYTLYTVSCGGLHTSLTCHCHLKQDFHAINYDNCKQCKIGICNQTDQLVATNLFWSLVTILTLGYILPFGKLSLLLRIYSLTLDN